jgi:hypothetical protein
MIGRQERFCGNILLYDYLSTKRAPVLLNRNLARALQIHRQLMRNGNEQRAIGNSHELRSVWQPPTWDALDEMIEDDKSRACFVLDIHSIKPMQVRNGSQPIERKEPTKKARNIFRAKSNIQVVVSSPSSNLPYLSIPAQHATLQGLPRQTDKAVSVETDRFTLNPTLLDLPQDTKDAYEMNISINIQTVDEAKDLSKYLTTEPALAQEQSTRLSATWTNIRDCPSGKTLLPLRDWKGALDFGLEVTMYWAPAAAVSILATHNRRLRGRTQLDKAQLSKLPTPPHYPDVSQAQIRLHFVYANETVTRSGFVCPHCERRRFSGINDLRMHLDGFHDNCKYEASNKGIDDGIQTWIFNSEVSDHKANRVEHRASARADEPFDVRMIPPPEPFNERLYLDEGNTDYQKMSRVTKTYTAVSGGHHLNIVPPRRKPPDQVNGIPRKEKKKHPVPEAPPGITFFRSCSRRPLRTGEAISESDDEVDDTWIKLRKSAELKKDEKATEAAKRLLKVLDNHIWQEQLHSDLHLGDALIRFVREKRTWIWQADVFDAIKDKMDELLQDNIISETTYEYCLATVKDAKLAAATEASEISHRLAQLKVHPSDDDLSRNPSPARHAPEKRSKLANARRIDKGKGKAKVTETGHLTPLTADSDGDLDMRDHSLSTTADAAVNTEVEKQATEATTFDTCVCGLDAQASDRKAPMIACANIVRPSSPHPFTPCTRLDY